MENNLIQEVKKLEQRRTRCKCQMYLSNPVEKIAAWTVIHSGWIDLGRFFKLNSNLFFSSFLLILKKN